MEEAAATNGEAASAAAVPESGSDGAKPAVNPLRLARPLEKSPAAGLVKTAIPPSRPMPMPTISPLCPPGANKNGLKPASGPVGSSVPPAPAETEKPTEERVKEETAIDNVDTTAAAETENKVVSKPNVEAKQKLVPPKKSMSPIPSAAAPPRVSPVQEKEASVAKEASDVSPKKVVEGPKIPVAEKTPRQTKRKKSQEVDPLPEEEVRSSKRSRVPPAVYTSPDPEMAQILKTIKKQEEEGKKKPPVKSGGGKIKVETSKSETAKPKSGQKKGKATKPKRKKVVISDEEDDDEPDFEQESENDEDYEPVEPKPKTTIKKRGAHQPKQTKKETPARKKTNKRDPVFFKDECLAVRNDEGSFYLCKAMQNIYLGSRNITIQWLSNEDHIIPAKDNPGRDIYAPDFYDKTDFETILTSVEVEKTLGKKSKKVVLPEEELSRINKILQRANDKASGKLVMADIELTEDNPDGLDISLYKGEEQLDEIEKRKAGKEKRIEPSKPSKTKEDSEAAKTNPDTENGKKSRGRAKKEPAKEEEDKEDSGESNKKRARRRSTKNISYDQYDFLEDDDDEVIPQPKKRKSQDSVTATGESNDAPKTVEEEETVNKSEGVKEKESVGVADTTEATSSESDTQQPAKKRGKKGKEQE